MPKPTASPASLQGEGRSSALSSFRMADALLSRIAEVINTLFSRTPAGSSFHQHTLKLREDLEALQSMVQMIQAVLADAEMKEIHENSVKLWLTELRCLAYDADDVLDEYNYLVLRDQVKAGIQSDGASRSPPRKRKHPQGKVKSLTMASSSSSSSSDGSTWNKLADSMGKIRLRFEEISHQRKALKLSKGDGRPRQNPAVRPPSSHLPDTPTIFGREEIMEEVISMLLSLADGGEKRTLSVLPIVGMGGVGKTTLVQHVYNDQRVCGRFPSRAWVCVSDDFAVDSLTKRIIESLTRRPCQLNEFDAIQSELIQELKMGKRLLVVLDDVWTENKFFWDSLLRPFKSAGVGGSAVIVTSRNESIPPRIVETMPFRRLGGLSDDSCWLIFEENAFLGRDPADHGDLVQIGKKIVKKCKGLPLAVKMLASLLSNEVNRDRWEDILQSEVWDGPDQYDEIVPALRLSYLYLPSYLKPCFLYASVFPKDYKFGKEQLVQLWMAQGFLKCEEGGKQVEDIGNMYFNDLMQRSLFSPSDRYFVLHDLIHDLARHISEGEITSCIGKEEVGGDKFFPVGRSEVRHLSISHHQGIEGIERMLQSLCSDEPRVIRSLLVLSVGLPNDELLKLPSEMVPSLESLRALDLRYFPLSELADSMGSLRHLRYLNLGRKKLPQIMGYLKGLHFPNLERNKGIRRLLETIGMLYNLQVLNLEDRGEVECLPECIGGLCNLRYLNLRSCLKMESLPESIGGLCKLRYLNLYGCSVLKSLPDSIGGLRNLRYLNLEFCSKMESLPESIRGLGNLRYLNLECCFKMKSLPERIGNLSSLRYLNLKQCWEMESLPESIGDLCNLQDLKLTASSKISFLPESIGGLSNLQCLEMECSAIFSYPRGMSRLTNLRSLVGFKIGSGEVHGIELLKDMVHLRGRLQIEDLANVVNPKDAVTANLRNKKHITHLRLVWGWPNGDNDDGEKAYRVLENLRPPNGLEELGIRGYGGIRFPSWMGGDASSFSRLTHVELSYCIRCTLLPPLGQLPSLKHLEIREVWDVERVGPEFRGVGFPALEVLHFERMSSWVTWDAAERGGFPRLRQLHVSYCSQLQSMVPVYLFPALKELQIKDCGSLRSIELGMPSSSSSSSSIGPPPLVKMAIWECPLACFSPEDEPLLLPDTLQDFSIDSGCPLLLDWCRREHGRRRLARIPRVDIPGRLETVNDWDSGWD